MIRPFYTIDDIPEKEKDDKFWDALTNEQVKHSINFLILNTIREYKTEQLSDAQCRDRLCKLKAYQELIDFPEALTTNKSDDTLNEKLP